MRNRRNRHEQPSPTTLKVPEGDDLGLALDALNAWGWLEGWQEANLKQISCYGPGVFRGYLPIPWTGVVLWYKPRGYYFYSTLYMIGVWAVRREAGIEILVANKEAAYTHPIFNAEGYYRRIKTEFRTFYQDDGSPPHATNPLFVQLYDPMNRLEMRQEVAHLLKSWADKHNQAEQASNH
jgi:hypothetical protein